MNKVLKHALLLVILSFALVTLPSASNAPSLPKKRAIDYITDFQVAEYEKFGIEQELGKMTKHRTNESGGITTISWDKDED